MPDLVALNACEQITESLSELASAPESLCGRVPAYHAIELTLSAISGGRSPAPTDQDAIEMLGWLELPLDDAPALVVTNMR